MEGSQWASHKAVSKSSGLQLARVVDQDRIPSIEFLQRASLSRETAVAKRTHQSVPWQGLHGQHRQDGNSLFGHGGKVMVEAWA